MADKMHEVAFDTEAEIVDSPERVATVEGEAASPVITGLGVLTVLAAAGAADHNPHMPKSPSPITAAIRLRILM